MAFVLDKKIDQQLIEDYSSGKYRLREIAAILDVSTTMAFHLLVKHGYVPKRLGARKRFTKIPDDLRLRFYEGTDSINHLCREMGCSPSTFRKLLGIDDKINCKEVIALKELRLKTEQEKRRDRIIQDLLEGATLRQVAKKYKVTYQRIQQIAAEKSSNLMLTNGMIVIKCADCPNRVAVDKTRGKVLCSTCLLNYLQNQE